MYLVQLEIPASVPEAVGPLAQTSKQLQATVAAAHSLWQSECVRIGWAAQQAVAPSTSADNPTWFQYFCARMRIRHQVRRGSALLCAELSQPVLSLTAEALQLPSSAGSEHATCRAGRRTSGSCPSSRDCRCKASGPATPSPRWRLLSRSWGSRCQWRCGKCSGSETGRNHMPPTLSRDDACSGELACGLMQDWHAVCCMMPAVDGAGCRCS